jgi:lysozyme family protein
MKELTIILQKMLGVDADGVIGSQTLAAIATALGATVSSYKATTIKNIQKAVGATADGVLGSKTLNAIIGKLGNSVIKKQEVDPLIQKYIDKPIKYSEVNYKSSLVKQSVLRSGNSAFGKAGCENMLVNVPVPANYPLKYDGKPVKSIRIHKLVADRLAAALQDIINHYGEDIEKVAPGACVYDGSYNFRKTTGTTSYSIHSWGLALDFDASNNTMKMSAPKARLSQPIYEPFWNILEYHGFNSLGRRGNYDWQHCQATHWG